MQYIRRIADAEIDRKAEAFNAIQILGPKGSGKTRTAKERCKTVIEFQDEERRDSLLEIAETSPKLFLNNQRPILFDEWQDAPKIWGTIRKDCDDHPEAIGEYFLTGSTSQKVETPHTGTGRITTVELYPMSLYETGDSNGSVSLTDLFEDTSGSLDGAQSALHLEDLFYILCRGGWPRCLALQSNAGKLEVARDYFKQIYKRDISAIDGIDRNPEWTRTLLWSFARNMATTIKNASIYADVQAVHSVSDNTLSAYIDALKRLYVLQCIDAWTPQVRSKTAIRSAKKRIFVDPSIGLAALGIGPEYFYKDLDLFGHAFENMVLRDLLAYASAHGARLMHYTDDMGLEADAVYQLADGRYALIEIKTGTNSIPAAEKNLLRFQGVIRAHNEKALRSESHPRAVYREPSLLLVICANARMSYTTANGVRVVPAGCLRD